MSVPKELLELSCEVLFLLLSSPLFLAPDSAWTKEKVSNFLVDAKGGLYGFVYGKAEN